ncbi:MAG: hypothetical protein IKM38_08890 [Christensenellaceae bacterium]|nr:hypothetical protein [Christensenellaceae bacterium]
MNAEEKIYERICRIKRIRNAAEREEYRISVFPDAERRSVKKEETEKTAEKTVFYRNEKRTERVFPQEKKEIHINLGGIYLGEKADAESIAEEIMEKLYRAFSLI